MAISECGETGDGAEAVGVIWDSGGIESGGTDMGLEVVEVGVEAGSDCAEGWAMGLGFSMA